MNVAEILMTALVLAFVLMIGGSVVYVVKRSVAAMTTDRVAILPGGDHVIDVYSFRFAYVAAEGTTNDGGVLFRVIAVFARPGGELALPITDHISRDSARAELKSFEEWLRARQ